MQRTDLWVVTGNARDERGHTVTVRRGVVACDLEDAISAFKAACPTATLWTVAHQGKVDIASSSAVSRMGGEHE